MNKQELENHIKLCQINEEKVFRLNREYGINIFNTDTSNFYNELNGIIHKLRVEIFGEEKTDVIEHYIYNEDPPFDSFNDLCDFLKIEN